MNILFQKFIQFSKRISNHDYYVQKIEYTHSEYMRGTSNLTSSNDLIYMAICMYTNSLKLDIKNSDIESIINKNDQITNQMYQTRTFPIKQIEFIFKPTVNNWISATNEIDLSFEKKQTQQNISGLLTNCEIYSILIRSKTFKNIKEYIDKSMVYYENKLVNNDDFKRYLYLPKYGTNNESTLLFDSHLLSCDKTFDSLFIPNKVNLINLITNFQNRTGKYNIPGVKQHLGLLLHGPSGTGKTSLIKSIAEMFNRNIVTIPLSLISTNHELFELMFNLNYINKNENNNPTNSMMVPPKKTINFNELIFVIEDIDAVSNIVHERSCSIVVNDEDEENNNVNDEENTNNKLDNMNKMLDVLTERIIQPMGGMMPTMPTMPQQKLTPPNNNNKNKENKDKLNLAGILNAIDGIIDAPGRMIIITSNFPEKLDKALIRPGRIDKIINLDYIKEEQAIEMYNHFFKSDDVLENKTTIEDIIKHNKFTPAQIEQHALESQCVKDFIKILSDQKLK